MICVQAFLEPSGYHGVVVVLTFLKLNFTGLNPSRVVCLVVTNQSLFDQLANAMIQLSTSHEAFLA